MTETLTPADEPAAGEAEARPEQGSLSVRLAANSLVQVVGAVLASAIGFVTFIVTARVLGPSIYGDLTAANAFLYVPTVLAEVGLSMIVVREISADEDSTEEIVGGSLPLRAVIGVATVTLSVLVALALPFNHRTTLAIVVGSPGAFFTVMTLAVQPVLQARLKMQWAVVATLVGRLATLGLTIVALTGGLGYLAVMGATVIGLGLTLALSVVFVRRLIRIRVRLDVSLWRRLIGPALFLALAVGTASVTTRIDAVLISLLKPSQDVGLYGAAFKFVDVSTLFASAIGISLFPVFSRFFASDPSRARALLQKSLDVVVAVAPPLVILIIGLAPQIVRYSAGHEFGGAVAVLQILAPSILVVFLRAPLSRFQIAAGEYRPLAWMMLAMLAFNVVLNLVLIPPYGIKAAAVVNLGTELLGFALQLAFVWKRLAFRPSLRYVPTVVGATALMAVWFAVLPGIPIAAAAVGALLYSVVLLAAPGVIRDLRRDAVAGLRA
jgi:O-antigen/teichoic acid export membrane protein